MSTVIFNGYIIDKELSLDELILKINEIGTALKTKITESFLKDSADLLQLFLDFKSMDDTLYDKDLIDLLQCKYNYEVKKGSRESYHHILRDIVKNNKTSNNYLENTFELSLNLIVTPLKEQTLIRVISNKDYFFDVLGGLDNKSNLVNGIIEDVKPYFYWNNTDVRENGISELEWDERREMWDKHLSFKFPFNIKVGYDYIETNLLNKKEILKIINSRYEDRVNYIAEYFANNEIEERYSEETKKIYSSTKSINKVNRFMDELIKTEEYKDLFDKWKKLALKKIPKKYEENIKNIYVNS